MDERMFVNTGVRLTGQQRAKLDQLAKSLHTSRNRVFGLLLEAAEVTTPSARVALKNNSQTAQPLVVLESSTT